MVLYVVSAGFGNTKGSKEEGQGKEKGKKNKIDLHLLAAVDQTLLGGRNALLFLDELLDLGYLWSSVSIF